MRRSWIAIIVSLLIISMPFTFAIELRLSYDANGNLVTGDGKFRVYNSLNQLSAIYNGTSASDPLLETYVYHPTEERIWYKASYYANGTVQETTYYQSENYVRVVNATGTFDVRYVKHGGQLVAQTVNGTTLFIHGNHEGSSSVITNSSGGVVERTEYSPFGEKLNASSVRYGYEGKESDSIVGDTDFNFRKYKAEWGMFTQPDSLIPNVYDPQVLNRYTFERNSPYKYADQTGHCIEDACILEIAVIIGAYVIGHYALSQDVLKEEEAKRRGDVAAQEAANRDFYINALLTAGGIGATVAGLNTISTLGTLSDFRTGYGAVKNLLQSLIAQKKEYPITERNRIGDSDYDTMLSDYYASRVRYYQSIQQTSNLVSESPSSSEKKSSNSGGGGGGSSHTETLNNGHVVTITVTCVADCG